ncbi:MAG: hypothetical protein AAGE80_17835 [Pseudomonadota bacterium]
MNGKLKRDDMIARRIPPAQIIKAFDEMREGEFAHPVISFDL